MLHCCFCGTSMEGLDWLMAPWRRHAEGHGKKVLKLHLCFPACAGCKETPARELAARVRGQIDRARRLAEEDEA